MNNNDAFREEIRRELLNVRDNMDEPSPIFYAPDYNGDRVKMETLLTFRNEETGADVIVYTDGSYVDEEDTVRVYAARYMIREDGCMELHEIENQREWDIVQELLYEIQEEMEGII